MFLSRKRTTIPRWQPPVLSLFCQQQQHVSLLLRSSFGRPMMNRQRCFICTTATTIGVPFVPSRRHFDITNTCTRIRRTLTTNVATGRNGCRNNDSPPFLGPVLDHPTVIPSWYEHPSHSTNYHPAATASEIVTNPPSFTSSSQDDQQLQLTRLTVQFLQHGVECHSSRHDPMMRDQQTVAMIQNLLESWIQYYYNTNKNTKSQQHSKDLSLRFITILFQKWFHCYSRNRQHAPMPNRHNSSQKMMHYLYRILFLLQQESKQLYYHHKKSRRDPNVSNSTRSKNHTYIQRSFQLLQTLYQYSKTHEEPQCHPIPKAYSMVLEALSYYKISRSDDDNDDPSDTTTATWNTRTIVGRADELMKQLHELYNHDRRRSSPFTHNNSDIALDDIRVVQNSYLRLLARLCERRPVDAMGSDERAPKTLNLAKKAEDYLWKHVQPQPLTSITPLDGMKSYSAVLQAYVNQNAPDQACAALNRMVHHGIRPDLVCYNICLQALGNAGHATQAHDLLLQMIQLSKEDNHRSADFTGSTNLPLLQPPDVYSYLAVIKAYANCYDVTNVILVFEQMIQNDIIPNTVIYTTVLDVLAHQPNSGLLVEEMLLYLERLHYGDTDSESHESKVAATGTANAATSFVKPCREAYTIAVRAWGKTTNDVNAPDRATNIFRRMKTLRLLQQDEEKEGTSSDCVGGDNDRLSPCTISYTSLIQAWAQSSRKDAPGRALQILRFMEQQQEIGAMPDTMTYNVVLHALARHGLATDAHQLLNEMIGRMMHDIDDSEKNTMYPNVVSWATVIQAFISSKGSNAGMKSNDLLLELEHLYDKTRIRSLQPTADIYSMAILAQISGDRVDVAEQLFWRMIDRYQQNSVVPIHNNHQPPNTNVCNALLHFWSRSNDPVAPQRAEMILRWMEDHTTYTAQRDDGAHLLLSVAPNQDSYQYVLRTWYRSKRRNAYLYIQNIQRKMQKLRSTAHVN